MNTINVFKLFGVNEKSLSSFFEKFDCQNISSKSVLGGCLYEAYTPYFLKSVNDGGKKVNIQLFCKDGEIVVGLPLIFTGF